MAGGARGSGKQLYLTARVTYVLFVHSIISEMQVKQIHEEYADMNSVCL